MHVSRLSTLPLTQLPGTLVDYSNNYFVVVVSLDLVAGPLPVSCETRLSRASVASYHYYYFYIVLATV